MAIKKLKLKKEFEIIKVDNMRFERCGEKWMGFLENGDEEIPIYVEMALHQIRECYRATNIFLKSIENRFSKRMEE